MPWSSGVLAGTTGDVNGAATRVGTDALQQGEAMSNGTVMRGLIANTSVMCTSISSVNDTSVRRVVPAVLSL